MLDASTTMGSVAPAVAVAASTDTLAELLRGRKKVGRHLLLEQIGAGAMGVVFRANDPELDREVAIKFFRRRKTAADDAAVKLALQEGRGLAKLSHPNVVAVHDVGELEGFVYLVMDYVEGWNLRDWVRKSPSMRQRLGVMVAAGRGLLAAHEAGLVHRDFKPGNVLVGTDGSVRVVDFGLVVESQTSTHSQRLSRTRVASKTDDADRSATHSSRKGGTPRYMAPEQIRGARPDERSDQFAFCVTAFELLFGVHPFHGETIQEVHAQILAGRARTPPRAARVPKRVVRALMRGLSRDPPARFPSMHELLLALVPDRRGRWVLAGGLGFMAIGAAANLGRGASCDDLAELQIDQHWNADVKRQVKAAFGATEAPFATDSWNKVEQRLDAYASTWLLHARTRCERESSGELDPRGHELRSSCFESRARRFGMLMDSFRNPDEGTVRTAVDSVDRLPPLERCLDDERLRSDSPLPDDQATAMQVESLRAELARVDVMLDTARWDEAAPGLDHLLGDAEALGYEPLTAEVLLAHSRLAKARQNVPLALERAQEALYLAIASGHGAVEVQAALSVAGLYVSRAELDRGRESLRHAQAAAERLHRYAEYEPRFLQIRGRAAIIGEDFVQAIAAFREALQRVDAQGDASDDGLRNALWHDLGNAYALAGQLEDALEAFQRYKQIRSDELGQQHPEIAQAAYSIGTTLLSIGDYEGAREHLQQSRDLHRRLGSPLQHLAAFGLGQVHVQLGEYERGLELIDAVLPELAALFGAEHPHLAVVRNNRGEALLALKRIDDAEQEAERALEITRRSIGTNHTAVAHAYGNLGLVWLERGELDRAESAFEQAYRIMLRTVGADQPFIVTSLAGLGRVALRRGDLRRARQHFERAYELVHTRHINDRAEITLNLATVVWRSDHNADMARALLSQLTDLANEDLVTTRDALRVEIDRAEAPGG